MRCLCRECPSTPQIPCTSVTSISNTSSGTLLANKSFNTLQTTNFTKETDEVVSDEMAFLIEDDSETPTDAWKRVTPLDSDDYSCDDKSSPGSSPPPANKNISFKPFTVSRAQKRAAAERLSRERLTDVERTKSASEDSATKTVSHAEERIAEEAHAGSTDLKSLIDTAKQKALANNRPKKANRVAELYKRSLNDQRLTLLLETALRTNATPEQQSELQRYIDGTKPTMVTTRDTTPKDATHTRSSTNVDDAEAQMKYTPDEATNMTTTQPTDPSAPELLATFCATQLWPRYCRLPPGPNTSVEFKAITSTTINSSGQNVPDHPVPKVWLEEVSTELSHLLQVERADRMVWIQKLMERPGHRGQDVHALLAEEVMWAIHHGPFKQREARGEIGVLLECVGIETKGFFWFK